VAADSTLSSVSRQPVLSAALSAPSPTDPAQPGNFPVSLDRVQRLRILVEPILRAEGVPVELLAVMLVESGGRLTALSPKGALGLWQLMPDTARRYGLTVTSAKDERVDAVKATRAAARYLHDLYDQFGDWKLALAAYNAGEQTVQRAMARINGRDPGRVLTLLPAETRAYVPAVMTALPLFGPANLATRMAPRF